MTIAIPISLVLLATSPLVQEPSFEERNALYDQFYRAHRIVRGGSVRAQWLDDGSTLLYRAGRDRMVLDPQEGIPREATKEDRDRVVDTTEPFRRDRIPSPAGDRTVLLDEGNLVVRGEDGEPDLRLTDDAEEDIIWMLGPNVWSADGSMLYSTRLDSRNVHQLPIVDFAQAVETVEFSRYTKTGTPFAEYGITVFHLPGGEKTVVDLGSDEDLYLFPLGWRGDREVLLLRLNREATRLDLMAADPASGRSRVILTDTQETFVGGLDFITGGFLAYFTPIEGTDRFLWLSERDGWRHVYQYDYDGKLISRVTEGEFPVLQVVDVDVERERAFVMANAEERLYDTHLYRADLAGGELRRLTDGDGEHEVQMSPSKLYFVDSHSSLDRVPVSELRDVEGNLVRVLDTANVSALDEMGWLPPEPFVVKADDGETDLYGVIYKPKYVDPSKRYPVIDFIYTGPFITVVPNDFRQSTHLASRAQAMAQMGFITFIVDPRGTTERGKSFQDASYGRIGEIEIPDHVAALRQIAASRPYMDLERVGVYGHSWGGYFALRAMLTAPEVFNVGVSGAPGELTENAPINEPYMRLPENNPDGYAASYNAPLAANLEGELLIMHGTADTNAPFSTSIRMVDALIKADKPFELLVLPGADHSLQGVYGRYALKRMKAFFLEHLRGEIVVR